ncbi:MAG: hypothetical protein HQM04_04890 [Magnetococcales bacterium]|nr:hypothetical protein [Magnetococcales bacterium]MBF0114362.1 hypothetical protein [Magnetococcales bacterium]
MTDRVKAYRERQKAAGLAQLSLWLDNGTIQLLKQLSEQQQRPPGDIVAAALLQSGLGDSAKREATPAPVQEEGPPLPELVRQVVSEVLAQIQPAAPPPPEESTPPETTPVTLIESSLPCPFLYQRPMPL